MFVVIIFYVDRAPPPIFEEGTLVLSLQTVVLAYVYGYFDSAGLVDDFDWHRFSPFFLFLLRLSVQHCERADWKHLR